MKNSPTRTVLTLLWTIFAVSPVLTGAQVIWMEDFETNGEGVRYASPHLFYDPTTTDDYWGRVEGEIMTYADPPSPGSTVAIVGLGDPNYQLGEYTGYHGGYYFAGEHLSDVAGNGSPDGLPEKEILFSGIDISNGTDLQFKGLFAAGAETGCANSTYDAGDFIKVLYSVDNGPFVLGLCFNPDINCVSNGNSIDEPLYSDPDCDGDGGEGVMLGNAFQEFSFGIPNGNTLDLKVVVSSNHDGEEMAFDHLRVQSAGNPCTDPVISQVTKSGDACQAGKPVTLTVVGDLNDALNWYWYTGSCGQTPAGTGASITVTPAMTTTYYVRGEPACFDPLPCVSITVNVGTDNTPPVLTIPADVTLECGESIDPPSITCGPTVILTSGLTVSLPSSGALTLPAAHFDAGSTDGCGTGGLTFSFSPNPANTSKVYNCTHIGTHAVNIWAIDGDGNAHSGTVQLLVQDPFDYCTNGGNGCQPIPVLYSTLAANLQPNGAVTLDASKWDAGSINACQSGNLTFSFSSNTSDQTHTFTCDDLGAQLVTIWVTDGSNNQARADVTLIVQDEANYCTSPGNFCEQYGVLHHQLVLNLPPNRKGALYANQFNVGSEDVCNTGGLNYVLVNPAPAPAKAYTCADLGVQVEQILVVDATGHPITMEVSVHVMDREGVCDGPGFAEATDDCDPSPTVSYSDQSAPGSCPEVELITRTWTATDATGNSTSADQVITIEDHTPPVVICPDDQNEVLGPTCSFMVPDYTSLVTAGDGCSAELTIEQVPAAGQSLSSSSSIAITVLDDCENPATCTFQLTLSDETDPQITCPSNQEATPNGDCTYDLEDYTGLAQATDNCDNDLTLIQTPAPGSTLSGTTVVTITATDDAGHSASCTFEVTGEDLPPVFSATPADITVHCESNVPGNQGVQAFDDCDGQIQVFFSQSGLPLSCPGSGTVINTWTATDSGGHTIMYSQTVTVEDGVPPVLSALPADITVSCFGNVPGNQGITATDNCEGLLTPVFIQSAAPPCNGAGVVTNSWVAQDCHGNSTVHVQTVTIQDNEPPVFNNPPQDITVTCAANVPGSQGLTASDNCGGAVTVSFSQSPLPACPGQGTVTNTWTATDCANNTATYSQIVTIHDNVLPVLSAYPASGTASCVGDVPGDPGITATDNCGGSLSVSFTQNIDSTCPGSGVVTNTWTTSDCAGNTETHVQTILIDDNEAPEFSAYPADLTVTCLGDVPGDPGITATDNCGGSINVVFNQVLPSACTGVATNTWTAIDCAGNTASYTQVVTITDNVPPTLSAYPTALTVSCSSQVPGNQGITGSDNCGAPVSFVFTQSPLPTCAGQGLVVNTWTATDCAGNSTVHTQIITIDDNTAPVFSALPGNLTVACEANIPGAQGITASDNCAGPVSVSFTQTGLPLSYPNPGVVTNTWTATDCAGNSTVHTQIITIDDNVAPVALCKNITVTLSVNGQVTITPAQVNNGSFDNCGIASYAVDPSLFTCDEVGVYPVELTVMDLFENTASCTAYVNVIASAICPDPGISYYGGPTVSDPCTCLSNGRFEEEVVIGPTGPGQIWTVTSTTLLNPNTMLPFPAGTQLVEHDQGGGQSIYTLVGIHLDGIGYTFQAASPSYPGLVLALSNVCYYPDPQILGLDGPFCIYSNPVTLEGDVGGVTLVSEEFTIDGAPATVFDPFDLGVGNYQVEYTVDAGTAAPGDPSDPGCVASTSEMVQVLQTPSTLACNNLITVGVDGNCEALITPDMILDGTYLCYDDYSVTVKKNVNVLPNPVPGAYIGQTLTVTIKHLPSGNSCWGMLILEDNLPPVFDCTTTPVEIACSGALSSIPPPEAFDNCTSVTYSLVDEIIVDSEPCGDNTVVIHRVWVATDTYGNDSAPCTQVIEIIRPDDVDFPNDIVWSCNQYDQYPGILNAVSLHPSILALQSGISPINASGITAPVVLNNTGSGKPEGLQGTYCDYSITHSDQILSGCGSSFTVVRTWTVLDWCTGMVITENNAGEDNVQLISVGDQVAPVITRPPFSVNAGVPANGTQPCTSQGLLLPPVVTDNCNAWTVLIFTPVGEAIYVNGQNGTQGGFIPAPGLPIGVHNVIYQATDACGNVKELVVQVTVIDNISPVAVCDEITSVTLSSDGKAVVGATVFDDGSTDNCCLDYFQVRRMQDACGIPGNLNFGPTVTFCCDDIGPDPVQVVLRVYDCFGNYNDCMVMVNVEDKLPPFVITCPSNQAITCETYQMELAAGLQQGDYSVLDDYGTPLFYDNCGLEVTQEVTLNINSCSAGTITRQWTAEDPNGNAPASCTQVITVQHVSNWVVSFPANLSATCTDGQLPPFGEPAIFFDDCELVGTSFDDQLFTVSNGSCYMIVRTWTVINWCLYDEYGYNAFTEFSEIQANQDFDGDGDKDNRTFKDGVNNGIGPDGFIIYNQTISVIDNEAPVFEVNDLDICILENDCNTNVNLLIPLVDDCSSDIAIEVTTNLPNGSGFGPYLDVPPGVYTAEYAVTDGCNNTAYQEITITVEDCKNPTPLCDNGLVINIMQSGMVGVTAEALDEGSTDNCTGGLQFSFSSDVTDTIVWYTCDDLGEQPVEMWVTDASGNQDFCTSFIEVQDNMNVCGQTQQVTVAGVIEQENGNAVSNVMVEINGGMASMPTDYMGAYSFDLPSEDDYTVVPSLNTFPANGVTTLDMIIIKKHILGTQLLDSPYKIIAADANKSGAVTTIDLVVIQKIILLMIPNFPSNTSWRFVDLDYVFPNPQNPWQGTFPEVISFNNLTIDELYTDFVAVKVGDVNLSANGNYQGGLEERTYAGALELVTDERELRAGEEFTTTFRLRPATLYGYQFTLDFPVEAIAWDGLTPGFVPEDHFGWSLLGEGAITANWLSTEPVGLDEETTLFQLHGRALQDGKLSEWLHISSRFTPKEAYRESGEMLDVRLLFEGAPTQDEVFVLYQNRPNPFRHDTQIAFELPAPTTARLTVWDVSGKILKEVEGAFDKGYHEIQLGQLMVSGVLYYKLETPTHVAIRKMIALE